MRYVAAYLLAGLGGNEHPDSAAIKKILSAVGVDFDEAKAKKVIESLKGKSTEELIMKGKEKLASVPSAAAVAAPAAAAAAPAAGGKGAEPKKEEKKKEEKKEESEDEDMGFGLFD